MTQTLSERAKITSRSKTLAQHDRIHGFEKKSHCSTIELVTIKFQFSTLDSSYKSPHSIHLMVLRKTNDVVLCTCHLFILYKLFTLLLNERLWSRSSAWRSLGNVANIKTFGNGSNGTPSKWLKEQSKKFCDFANALRQIVATIFVLECARGKRRIDYVEINSPWDALDCQNS